MDVETKGEIDEEEEDEQFRFGYGYGYACVWVWFFHIAPHNSFAKNLDSHSILVLITNGFIG